MDLILPVMVVINFAVFWFFLGVLLSSNVITLLSDKKQNANDFSRYSEEKSEADKRKLEQLDELLNYQVKGGESSGD